MKMPRIVALILVALLLGGCAEVFFAAAGVTASTIGVYQRWEDRKAQKKQTQQLKKLTDEVIKLREVEKQLLGVTEGVTEKAAPTP